MVDSISYAFEKDLLVLTVHDTMNIEGVRDLTARLHDDDRYDPAMNRLWDMRGASLRTFSAPLQRQVASHLGAKSPDKRVSGRIAFLVDSDVNFGVMRMFEVYIDGTDSARRKVFRDQAKARAWLAEG